MTFRLPMSYDDRGGGRGGKNKFLVWNKEENRGMIRSLWEDELYHRHLDFLAYEIEPFSEKFIRVPRLLENLENFVEN